jgi:ABC-type antimicrobial peptide transport system permease subunit
VLRESLAVGSIGIAFAIPVAIALGQSIRALLFGVTPLDPASLIGAALLLLAVATTAGLIPARRAAAVDPVRALKGE